MKRFFSFLIYGIVLSVGLVQSAVAQDDRAQAESALRAMAVSNAAHSGSSPFSPPGKNDVTFIADTGSGLDTGCSYRSGGILTIHFKVDRVIGVTAAADILALERKGLISPTAMLQMPAYDVDYVSGSSQILPERDRVRVNGNIVSTEFLNGINDTWVSNRFDIPTEWLNFPADPGKGGTVVPADNIITIEIDTLNTVDTWCTAIDWVAVTIQAVRPVVFVHGILSNGGVWDQASPNASWVKSLQDQVTKLGVLNTNELNLGNLDTIGNNAKKIADVVTAVRARWGVDQVNLVTHSKGGIDSREYARSSNAVEQLIEIGTPNAGSPLADFIEGGAYLIFGTANATKANLWVGGLGGLQLTRPYMAFYNLLYKPNLGVRYVTLPGDYELDANSSAADRFTTFIVGQGDAIVPLTSVPLSYATNLKAFVSTGSNTEAKHYGFNAAASLTGSPNVVNLLLPYLTAAETPLKANNIFSPPAPQEQLESALATTTTIANASTWSTAGTIKQSETQTGTIVVDASTSASFAMMYSSGTLDLSLTAPSGIVYTSASAVNNSSVSYSNGDILGGELAVYAISNPETGTWKYTVTGSKVTDTTGSTSYSINALLQGTTIAMTAGFVSATVHSGDALKLQAALTNGTAALTGATVVAQVVLPDSTVVKQTLYDDGTNGDTTKNDGIYNANFTQTTTAGNYAVTFQANGTSPLFQRQAFNLATVSLSTSTLSGTYTDSVSDTDSDGLYNQLNLDVGVKITKAASYRVLAVLSDSKGNTLTGSTDAALTTSDSNVRVTFDGAALYLNGVDGPYTISRVTLAEITDTAILITDEKTNVRTTSAYKAATFQHDALSTTGNGVATGVDTNSNKLFDTLKVTFDVTSLVSGSYNWSARMTDKNGIGITLAANSGTLKVGTNTLELDFDGSDIGKHGVNGPYQLNDLLLYGGTRTLSVAHVFSTGAFTASQFEGFTKQALIATVNSLSRTTPSSGTPNAGDTISVAAYVTPSAGTGKPTGTITFSVDGTAQSPVTLVNGSASLTTTLGGGSHPVTAVYAGDGDYAASTSSALSLAVNPAVTTVALSASPSTFTYLDATSLRAVVASTYKGTIAGTVTFTQINADGSKTTLGTGTIALDASGAYVATLTGKTFAAPGSVTISASYGGSTTYSSSTSSNTILTVTDKADITLGGVPATATVSRGGSTNVALTLSTVNGFSDTATLACSGLPSGSTCKFTAGTATGTASINLTPSSGAYPASVQMTITADNSASLRPSPGTRWTLPVTLAGLLMVPLLAGGRRRRRLSGLLMIAVLAIVSTAAIGCSSGSSSGSGSGGTSTTTLPPKTSTATLTLSSTGAHPVSHSYTISVTVQ